MSAMEKRSTQAEVRLQATITALQQELEQQREEHHKEVQRNRKFVFILIGQLSWFAGPVPLSLPPSFQMCSRRVGSCWRCRIRSPAAWETLRSSWASGCNRPGTSSRRPDLPLLAYTPSFTAKNSSCRVLMRTCLSRYMTHKTSTDNIFILHPYYTSIHSPNRLSNVGSIPASQADGRETNWIDGQSQIKHFTCKNS